MKECSAAGMIVCKIFPRSGLKLLMLEKFNGKFDLPKGKKEKNESDFSCAKRELQEETSIKNFKLVSPKSFNCNGIKLFLCITEDLAKVEKNPKTEKFEHIDYLWVDTEVFESLIDRDLLPALDFFKRSIQQIMI